MQTNNHTRNVLFILMMMSCILAGFTQTCLNTALSPIMQDFHILESTVQWLISAYSLVAGIMILATPFLIRRYNNRPLFLTFSSIYTIGLLLSATSINFSMILVGRILQAIGYGLFISLTQVIILSTFSPEKIGTILGIYGLSVSVVPILAPTLSGMMIDHLGWRSLFYLSLILSLIVFILGLLFMKNLTKTGDEHFDLLSFVLSGIGFCGIVIGFSNMGSYGFNSLWVFIPIIIGILAFSFFVRRQLILKSPFIHMAIFRDFRFRNAVIASMIIYSTLMAVATLLPIYIQSYRGFSVAISGMVTLPGALISAFGSLIAGKIYDKYGIKKLYITGSFRIFVAGIGLSLLGTDTPLWLSSYIYFVLQE